MFSLLQLFSIGKEMGVGVDRWMRARREAGVRQEMGGFSQNSFRVSDKPACKPLSQVGILL